MLSIKKMSLVSLASLAVISYSPYAEAATTSSASITLESAYSIAETQPVNFGSAILGSTDMVLKLEGKTEVVSKLSGDGSLSPTVNPSAGYYSIAPTVSGFVPDFRFQISNVVPAVSGVTLQGFNGFYDKDVVFGSAQSGVYSTLSTHSYSNGLVLRLGGEMFIPKGASTGAHTVNFDISVIYN